MAAYWSENARPLSAFFGQTPLRSLIRTLPSIPTHFLSRQLSFLLHEEDTNASLLLQGI
jgi:hypothetical protein